MKASIALLLCCVIGCGTAGAMKPGIEECVICGNEVSIKADTCPHCGEENPSKTRRAREKSRLLREAELRSVQLADLELEQAKRDAFVEQERLRPIKSSIVAMEEVKTRIDRYIQKHGKWPDDDIGKKIAFAVKDGWGYSLHFNFSDEAAGKYVIHCSGGDTSLRREYVMPK